MPARRRTASFLPVTLLTTVFVTPPKPPTPAPPPTVTPPALTKLPKNRGQTGRSLSLTSRITTLRGNTGARYRKNRGQTGRSPSLTSRITTLRGTRGHDTDSPRSQLRGDL